MGTGNYVTTLSGRNQQSNLDKIDNWETTRKYLFDRIFLYTAYSLILQIYFQRKILYLLHLFTLNEEISNEKIISNVTIRNMDSVTAAEWLQCLTSKLRCSSIFPVRKVLWLLWKTPRRNFIINFEKAPGIGFLAGWRGENGENSLRGKPNPNQTKCKGRQKRGPARSGCET